MLKAVFFDLDGTLLRIDEGKFTRKYFSLLSKKVAPLGYEGKDFIDNLLLGCQLMMNNDGKKRNCEVFWDFFKSKYGEKVIDDIPVFDSFYQCEFKQIESECVKTPLSAEIVKKTRELSLLPVLSTNPIFPMAGQKTRLEILGLKESDFTYVSSYENSSFCKPNPAYFENLLSLLELDPSEVIVFGNNDYEDGDCALKCGLTVYLVDGYLIHSPKCEYQHKVIKIDEVLKTIERERRERE